MKWLPFPLCAKYEVSDDGFIRHAISGRIMKGGLSHYGYRQVSFRTGGKYGPHVGYTVHRMVMLTFVGARPPGFNIDHINRDRKDNRLSNLRYIPEAENSAQGGSWHRGRKKSPEHSAKVGAAMRGQKHPGAKLTDDQAAEIINRRLSGETLNALAVAFGVCKATIYGIASGRIRKFTYADRVFAVGSTNN